MTIIVVVHDWIQSLALKATANCQLWLNSDEMNTEVKRV